MGFVSVIIMAAKITMHPAVVRAPIFSDKNITENKAPNTDSVDNRIAAFGPSVCLWQIVCKRKAKVVLTRPRYIAAKTGPVDILMDLGLIVDKKTIIETQLAVAICIIVSVIGLEPSFKNSPVKKICSAKQTAQNKVKVSPILSAAPPLSDIKPTPNSAKHGPIILCMPILALWYIKEIIGTITTLTAVKKAFFDGVVYLRPKVWSRNPVNKNRPSIMPCLRATLSIFFRCL